MTKRSSTPPVNTRWIMGDRDLPQNYGDAQFNVADDDNPDLVITVSKRMRQTLEALIVGPVYCASPIRLSHYVDILRDDHRIKIETLWFTDSKGPMKTRYGVYKLLSEIKEVAA